MIPIWKLRYIFLFFSVCRSITSTDDNKICTNGYTLKNNKCWKLYDSLTNETYANEICRIDGGAILATLKNRIENRELSHFLNNTDVDVLWLGMTCTGLTKQTCKWVDETSVDFENFISTHPNDADGNCVYYSVNSQRTWSSGNCYETLPFVCELPTTTPDNSGICEFNYNNYCYHQNDNPEPKSFSNAQNICNVIDSNLASIHSYLENRFIQSVFANETSIWLGGMSPDKELIVWDDRSVDDYNNLADIQDGNCVEMPMYDKNNINTWSWYGRKCSEEKHFICKHATSQN